MKESSEFDVQIHEAGPDSKARLKSLFNYMQTSADRHSNSLGTSMALMAEKNLTWVYSRFYAEVNRYPELYDKVNCETWRSEVQNGLVRREFIIRSDGGDTLVQATSSLALIDRISRKPVPIPELIISKLEHRKESGIDFPLKNIENKVSYDYIYSVKARYDDIDINGHMNNASYAGLFFESVFENMEKPVNLKSIDISFRGEIIYGNELECGVAMIADSPGKFYHRLFNKTKGKVSADAVTVWSNIL